MGEPKRYLLAGETCQRDRPYLRLGSSFLAHPSHFLRDSPNLDSSQSRICETASLAATPLDVLCGLALRFITCPSELNVGHDSCAEKNRSSGIDVHGLVDDSPRTFRNRTVWFLRALCGDVLVTTERLNVTRVEVIIGGAFSNGQMFRYQELRRKL